MFGQQTISREDPPLDEKPSKDAAFGRRPRRLDLLSQREGGGSYEEQLVCRRRGVDAILREPPPERVGGAHDERLHQTDIGPQPDEGGQQHAGHPTPKIVNPLAFVKCLAHRPRVTTNVQDIAYR